MARWLMAALTCFYAALPAQTVGLMLHTPLSLDSGVVLFAPMTGKTTYLIDKCGRKIHEWESGYYCGLSVYLLPDGNLLRTGNDQHNYLFAMPGRGGILEKLDWGGNVLWHYALSDSLQCQHHDVEPLPNGNILAVAWERKDSLEAFAVGRKPSLLTTDLWPEKIVEIRPVGADSGVIVWEWHVWDHLVQDFDPGLPGYGVISEHPELININRLLRGNAGPDWLHVNSVKYNAALDQIVISAHHFCEIWVIDHSTTTAEAATHAGGLHGKGGDLLYRWGNPAAYGRGTAADQKFFGQHDPYWIPEGFPHAGEIMVFNNNNEMATYSSVDIIQPPVDGQGNYDATALPFLPEAQEWRYMAPVPADFHSTDVSGAQMLENGNVLVCEGDKGRFFEVDSDGNRVWEYRNPVEAGAPVSQGTVLTQASVFRCAFYPYSYPGLAGQSLEAGAPIELNPLSYDCELNVTPLSMERPPAAPPSFTVFPGPVSSFLEIRGMGRPGRVTLFAMDGRKVLEATGQRRIDLSSCASGLYLLRVESPAGNLVRPMALVR